MSNWLAVFLGGGIGSMLRYGLGRLIPTPAAPAFPWSTFLANMSATALLGWYVLQLQERAGAHPAWKLFVVVGLCGGFSTFSTFSHENFALIRAGAPGLAAINIAASVIGGLVLLFLLAPRS